MWYVILMTLAIGYAVVVHWFAFVGGVFFLGITRAESRRAKAYAVRDANRAAVPAE
jgi:hypothetical protein